MTITITIEPIETAPKDRSIMVFRPKRGWAAARWDAQPSHKRPNPYWCSFMWQTSDCRDNPPTHWCELPSPLEVD